MVPALTATERLEADRAHVLARTEGLWRDLRGARLLITGGTGFVGAWLLEALRWANEAHGADVAALVLTRDPDGFAARRPHLAYGRGIALHRGDVRWFDAPGRFTHVIHGAASADAALYSRDPLAMFDTIVHGTRRTLARAAADRAPVLLLSSGAVYGTQPPDLERVPEDYPGAPDPLDAGQVYAESKRAAELLGAVHTRSSGLEVRIARLFAFVGPYLPLDRHFAVGNFIRDRLAGGPIAIAGDGTPRRSYLYGADLAIWLWTILVRGRPARPYNVGSERAQSIEEVARGVAEAEPPAVGMTRAKAAVPGLAADALRPRHLARPDGARARGVDRVRGRRPAHAPLGRAGVRPCPICLGTRADVLHRQPFVLPVGHPLGAGYDVVCCEACGFVYADTRVTQAEYDAYYARLSKYEDARTGTGGGEQAWDDARLAATAETVAQHVPARDTKIVDVGCANGGLLRHLGRLGFRPLVGVDPSPRCAAAADAVAGAVGRVGTLFSLPAEAGQAGPSCSPTCSSTCRTCAADWRPRERCSGPAGSSTSKSRTRPATRSVSRRRTRTSTPSTSTISARRR